MFKAYLDRTDASHGTACAPPFFLLLFYTFGGFLYTLHASQRLTDMRHIADVSFSGRIMAGTGRICIHIRVKDDERERINIYLYLLGT